MADLSTARPVAILGAGFLGHALAAALPPPVVATTRAGTWSGEQVPPGVLVRALDVVHSPSEHLRDAMRGARALVLSYAAGRAQDRRAVYLEGTRRVLAACEGAGLQRIVYTSSTSALPDVDGWLDEDCESWPDEDRGRVQREAEDLVIGECRRLGVPWVVLRLAGLYGPGRELGRIYHRDPGATLPGDGMQATNLVHRDDAVQAVLAALALDPACSALVHVCDDDHRPRRDMFALLAAAAHTPPPRWEVASSPHAPVRGKRVRNERLKALLGVCLRHPEHVL